MDAFNGLNTTNNTFTPIKLDDYKEKIAYDPNGNILNYIRRGTTDGSKSRAMDSLTYTYKNTTNQLRQINDDPTYSGNYDEDIDNQTNTDNYVYDKIGNLKSDAASGLTNIDWTVYGKIAGITKSSGTMTYTYDASGNRITKTVGNVTTVYVRDAQGNVMSVYQKTGSADIQQIETHLYGSSRLGVLKALTVAPSAVSMGTGTVYGNPLLRTFTRGEKNYELSNHLGNVLAVISDKKIAVSSGGSSSLIDHFEADIASAQDYYPFGMGMPGRTYSSGSYRYGFNGKENDNEVKGVGNQQDYGMRIYDPRIGKFLSNDPLIRKYPDLTPYQFASNTPIWAIDIDGAEGMIAMPDERTAKMNTIVAETIKDFVVERHEQGMNNIRVVEQAKVIAIKQGRADGDGITAWTKAMTYFGAWWFGGGINGTINPIQIAQDAKKDFQEGHYLMGTIGLVSIIPGLGEMKALKGLSAESKKLLRAVGKFEHATKEIAISTKSGVLADALHIATDLTGAVPEGAVEILGKQGILKGKAVGYQWRTEDGVFKRIRLDNDLKVGSHINVTVGKQDFSILINAGDNQAIQISDNEIMKTTLKNKQ